MVPRNPFLPKRYNKPKPTTVGGNTSGSKKSASTMVLPGNVLRDMSLAKKTPSTNTITVAIEAVLKDSQSGERFTSFIDNHLISFSETVFQ